MGGRAQWLLIGVVALAALGLGLWVGERHSRPEPPNGMTPERLYALTFADLEGRPQALGRWHGQVVVLNFWATWCPPCRAEMPEFVRVQQRYGARGFSFVGIALDEPAAVQAFARELGINYPLLIGGAQGATLARSLGSRGALPFSVILDRQGRIVATRLGTLSESELHQLLPPIL
ncbi:TlpA family protein disulfide reductase [Thiobacter aerophilum]|uniref:TlpA disulfide reductase family protein n=1 Tax=Thiobacter aerophilum TaxID=3121275 RepID=A0ABV0ED87_9BURK